MKLPTLLSLQPPSRMKLRTPLSLQPPSRMKPPTPLSLQPPSRMKPPTPLSLQPPSRMKPPTLLSLQPPSRMKLWTPLSLQPPSRMKPPTLLSLQPPSRMKPPTPLSLQPPSRMKPPTLLSLQPPSRMKPPTLLSLQPPSRMKPPTLLSLQPPSRMKPPTPLSLQPPSRMKLRTPLSLQPPSRMKLRTPLSLQPPSRMKLRTPLSLQPPPRMKLRTLLCVCLLVFSGAQVTLCSESLAFTVRPTELHNTTAETHNTTAETHNTTAETHNTTVETHNTTAETHNTTAEMHNTTAEMHNTTDVTQENCSYHDVLEHLQLKKRQDLFTLARPVKHHSTATDVGLLVLIYAILDMREIDQTFISYVWSTVDWQNDFIRWNPADFCGIRTLSVPAETLWKPDITIEEMTERDKSSPSPYMQVDHEGTVRYHNDQVVVSTCRMTIYKFPFDVQQCNLTFRSIVFGDKELTLTPNLDSADATDWTRDVMRTQYEWVFINMTITKSVTVQHHMEQDVVIISVNMQRRSLLYIVNFLFPVLFFLFLDLASFLMSDTGGEKLGFKITVLLAVTVMQLLLNDILPSSSKRVPLIAVFCIGIFSLMLLSLVESIVILYLINKDQEDGDRCGSAEEVIAHQGDGIPSESSLEKNLHVLTTVLSKLLQKQREGEGPGFWTKKAKTINKVFFVFYVCAALLFLGALSTHWTS